jgi:putative FmdB family regulatory protein
MPLYDFHCQQCARVSELLISGSAQPVCPECGSSAMEKLISVPAGPGRSKDLIQGARAQAAREGHFSHYSSSERRRGGVR